MRKKRELEAQGANLKDRDTLWIVSSFHGIHEMIYLLVSNAFMRRQMFPIGCKML